MSEKRTFTECLRLNIKENWSEGGMFESMTKDDCLKACDNIDRLQAELDKHRLDLNQIKSILEAYRGENVWNWKDEDIVNLIEHIILPESENDKSS